MISIFLSPASLDVSLIIPVFNEEGNICELAAEIDAALQNFRGRWECLWIDDGSTDATLKHLRRLSRRSHRHRWIALPHNAGQSAALAAGFLHARGRIFVTLDGDRQNVPADIPKLLRLLHDLHADMVTGYRVTRQDPWLRRISSRFANSFRNRLTGEHIRDVGCSLRAMRRECVAGLPLFRGMHRFLPTLVRLNGFARIVEVPVQQRPRTAGKSKYGIRNRLWVGLQDTLAMRWLLHRRVHADIFRKARSSPANRRHAQPTRVA